MNCFPVSSTLPLHQANASLRDSQSVLLLFFKVTDYLKPKTHFDTKSKILQLISNIDIMSSDRVNSPGGATILAKPKRLCIRPVYVKLIIHFISSSIVTAFN